MNKKLDLFLTFLKIGAFTFGGGYAMIPLIQNEAVEKKKWINEEEMVEIVAIAESTPGPIAINSATFVGYKVAGFWGSLFATLGVILPSLIIISIVSLFFDKFLEIKVIADIFRGVRAGVTVLILSAAIKMFKGVKKGFIAYLLIAISLFASLFIEFKFMTLSLIVFGAIIGILFQLDKPKKRGEEQ